MDKEDLTKVYRAYLAVVTLLYGGYGLNFLLFARRFTVVVIGGVLASPNVWGWLFVSSAVLIFQSLTRPDLLLLRDIAMAGMIALAAAYLTIRTIIVFATGIDFTASLIWLVFLLCHFLAIYVYSRMYPGKEKLMIPRFTTIIRGWLHVPTKEP